MTRSGAFLPAVQTAERIARSHHERSDGKGYPDGRAAEQIAIEPTRRRRRGFRRCAHARPTDRQAWSIEKTLAAIVAERGRHFDLAAVDALLAIRRAGLGLVVVPAPNA